MTRVKRSLRERANDRLPTSENGKLKEEDRIEITKGHGKDVFVNARTKKDDRVHGHQTVFHSKELQRMRERDRVVDRCGTSDLLCDNRDKYTCRANREPPRDEHVCLHVMRDANSEY